MEENFNLIRCINFQKWYMVYTDDDNLVIGGRELGDEKLLSTEQLSKILNEFFYTNYTETWFAAYAWITADLELVFLPTDIYDFRLLDNTLTKNILQTLNTRQNIETFYNVYMKV